ncbi:MAG TPA: iron chelate uptake ABC transporter family permease subunit [Actinomycetota bacterium]|nr:iron chelate uptake ABC transporter family permease subunit [Actinomycetota bacterium]
MLFGWMGDYTLRVVAAGSAVLGLVSGVLGSFALLRRQSLLGDALAHAALPGIALAFLLTRSKSPFTLLLGAGAAAWLAALLINAVTRTTRVKTDAAMGVVLSVFFGAGLVLLTYIQRLPDAGKAGLDTFLFGQAAALLGRDVVVMCVLGGAVLLVVALLWKQFKLLTFDPGFASSLGLPVRGLEIVLTSLLVVAIVIGLQTVGVVLMSALVVAPAAAARQWTNRLGTMVLLSGLFGALAGVSGAVISSSVERLPTGPTIVLVALLIVGLSILFAPRRGIVMGALRTRRSRNRVRSEVVLADLYLLSLQHEHQHPHSSEAIAALRFRPSYVDSSLQALAEAGMVSRVDGGWVLNEAGAEQARRLLATNPTAPEAMLVSSLTEEGAR